MAHDVGHHEERASTADHPAASMTTPASMADLRVRGRRILPALRRFRTADEEMRRRMSADMAMNVSDL